MLKPFTAYCSLLLFLSPVLLLAQTEIRGLLVDGEDRPVEFAEVLLMDADSIPLMSILAEQDGSFSLKTEPGNYLLQIRQLAEIFYFEPIEVVETAIDIGTIVIDKVYELEEMTVVGRAMRVRREVDRTVFDIEHSSASTRGDAVDVLTVTPGIQVQGEDIRMVGRSGLAVMVDGKMIRLSGEELTNFLRAIPSEDIKNIEVISTPPAKYEAIGNSGMINIQLKKARRDSWNAQLKTSYTKRVKNGNNQGASFNLNQSGLSFYASINRNYNHRLVDQDDWAYFPEEEWYVNSDLDFSGTFRSIILGAEYEISPRWKTGVGATLNKYKGGNDQTPYSAVFDRESHERIFYINTVSNRVLGSDFHSYNWFNDFALDTSGTKLSLNLDLFQFEHDDAIDYYGISANIEPRVNKYVAGVNKNDRRIDNYSAALDLSLPNSVADVETGLKFTSTTSENDITNFNSGEVLEPIEEMPLESYSFVYEEIVSSAYISASRKLNDKMEAKLGLRLEATNTDARSSGDGSNRKRNYMTLFPTAFLSYQIDESSSARFSANRRIQRPNFRQLNPNLDYTNPYQAIGGNPFLQPSFITNVELGYNYKGWDSKLYFTYQQDVFEQLAKADPETSFILFQDENYYNAYRYGISESYVFEGIDRWTSSNSFDINYTIAKSYFPGTDERTEGLIATFSTHNDFSLNASRTLIANLGLWYNFPKWEGVYKFKSQSNLSAGIQALFLDKRLSMSLNVNDILRTNEMDLEYTLNGVRQIGIYYWDHQSVRIAASYRFGNQKLRVRRNRGGNQEERNRAR